MSLALIYRLLLSLSHWRFSTMLLCRLFPPLPASAASPIGRAWLLINLFLLDLSSSVLSTSSCASLSYPPDPSMSISPFTLDLSLQLWFDSILFFFFFVFPFFPLSFFLFPFFFFFACNNAWSPLFNLPIYILMICGVFALGPNL
jgi:hypothetical protein